MPQLKQPMTLKDKSLQECVNLYCGTCERWILKLRQARKTGRKAYSNMIDSVLDECRQIEESLSEFPYSIIEMMSPQLTRRFAEMVDKYNFKYRRFNRRFDNEEKHNSVCIAMFRSVLTPYVYTYDKETFSFPFRQNLVVQTLDRVPGLRTLYLIHESREVGAQLARMIYRVSHLQSFTYPCHCTDEVVEQLGSHCSRLKELNLYLSRDVTNASVQHLLKLRELEFLNLDRTQIDEKHYGLLLSELPIIKNITFREMDENILDQVAEENLHKVSKVSGHVPNIHMLAQRCRNITTLDINDITEDMSCLAALTALRTVRISSRNHVTCNLNSLLTGIGPTLTELNLDWIKNVNLQDIVTLCPSLASLSLLRCTFLPLDPDTALNSRLPHFRNLTSLHIINICEDERIYYYIRHYVSLKKIRLEAIHIFTVEFVRELVRNGTLAQLEEFRIYESRHTGLTVEALEMVIQHCSHLKSIGYMEPRLRLEWSRLGELERRLVAQNVDFQFI